MFFSCLLTTVGISIVNACTVASLDRNAHFSEDEEPEVNCSNFMKFEQKIASDGAITIYIPRAFQRAVPHPLILQHVRKPKLLVRLGRFRAIFDIRICHSSY